VAGDDQRIARGRERGGDLGGDLGGERGGLDRAVGRRVDGVLKLAERRCVYDNLLVDNALCLPV